MNGLTWFKHVTQNSLDRNIANCSSKKDVLNRTRAHIAQGRKLQQQSAKPCFQKFLIIDVIIKHYLRLVLQRFHLKGVSKSLYIYKKTWNKHN